MINKILISVLLVLMLFGFGCTENVRTSIWGGTAHIAIPVNRKFVNITWKMQGPSLWVVTRDRGPSDTYETYYFSESSNFGVLQGEVIIKEER